MDSVDRESSVLLCWKTIQLPTNYRAESDCLCRVQEPGSNAVIEALRLNEPTVVHEGVKRFRPDP